jgi:hypothetical protein
MAALIVFSGCAHPPGFVRRSKSLMKTFYRPGTQDFLDNPDFSFQIDADWKGPETNKLGAVRYSEPKGRASFDMIYIKEGSSGWIEPVKYLQKMRETGAVEDAHLLEPLKIGNREGHRVVYTTYQYDPNYRVGEKFEVFQTEEIMAQDPEGYFVMRYKAEKKHFLRCRKALNDVLSSIVFEQRKGEVKEDVFSGMRRKRKVSDRMQIAAMERDEADRKANRRYIAGIQVGQARPLTLLSKENFPRRLRPGISVNAQFIYFWRTGIGLGAELGIDTYGKRKEFLAGFSPQPELTSEGTTTTFAMVGRYRLGSRNVWQPYLTGAVGYYSFSFSSALAGTGVSAVSQSLSSTGLAAGAGFGIERLIFNIVSLSAEARYRHYLLNNKFNGGSLEALGVLLGAHYLF